MLHITLNCTCHCPRPPVLAASRQRVRFNFVISMQALFKPGVCSVQHAAFGWESRNNVFWVLPGKCNSSGLSHMPLLSASFELMADCKADRWSDHVCVCVFAGYATPQADWKPNRQREGLISDPHTLPLLCPSLSPWRQEAMPPRQMCWLTCIR